MRVVALIFLLSVLPTMEAAEQIAHLVEHVLDADVPDHTAHHDGAPGDEHGCTGLVHLCGCHYTKVTAAVATVATRRDTAAAVTSAVPRSLADLTAPEPAQRPPIG